MPQAWKSLRPYHRGNSGRNYQAFGRFLRKGTDESACEKARGEVFLEIIRSKFREKQPGLEQMVPPQGCLSDSRLPFFS